VPPKGDYAEVVNTLLACSRCGDFLTPPLVELCATCAARPLAPRPLWITAALGVHVAAALNWNGLMFLWGCFFFLVGGAFDSPEPNRAVLLVTLATPIASCVAAIGLCTGSRRYAIGSLVVPWVSGVLWMTVLATSLHYGAGGFFYPEVEPRVLIPFGIQFLLALPGALYVLRRTKTPEPGVIVETSFTPS
jgi:hypothetical protein